MSAGPPGRGIETLGMAVAGIGLGIAWIWPWLGIVWVVVAMQTMIIGLGTSAFAPQIREVLA